MNAGYFPKIIFLALWLATQTGCLPHAHAQLTAFPGAEGYGKFAKGGRGGKIIEVTSLRDHGPGSLRAAVEAGGARIVVFRTGGTIELRNALKIREPYLTIAGQTAPGDGIALKGGGIKIGTHDVVIRGLRIRPGPNGAEDGLFLGPEASDVIIDRCSISWSVDENVASYGHNRDITVQWCIISEGLFESGHSKGAHSRGMRIGKARRGPGYHKISIHHTLFAHNNMRNANLMWESDTEFVNNVIYNWGKRATRVAAKAHTNIIGNLYKEGPTTKTRYKPITLEASDGGGDYPQPMAPQAFISGGNTWCNATAATVGIDHDIVDLSAGGTLSATPVAPESGIVLHSAETAYDLVLKYAGAAIPARDPVDARVIATVANSSGPRRDTTALVDHPQQVGGWPQLRAGMPQPDSDHDGMPDAWETANGLDADDASDGNADRDGDGYTNVEAYLNSLIPAIEP